MPIFNEVEEKLRIKNLLGKTRTVQTVLPQIRNTIVHHFYRFKDNEHNQLTSNLIKNDIKILSRLSNHTQVEKSTTNSETRKDECVRLFDLSIDLKKIEKTTVKDIAKFGYVISYLNKIDIFWKNDMELKQITTQYAIFMLLIAAATCMQDFKISLEKTLEINKKYKNEPSSLKDQKSLFKIFELFKTMKNVLAHEYMTLENTEETLDLIKKALAKFQTYITKLSEFISNIEKILEQKYEPITVEIKGKPAIINISRESITSTAAIIAKLDDGTITNIEQNEEDKDMLAFYEFLEKPSDSEKVEEIEIKAQNIDTLKRKHSALDEASTTQQPPIQAEEEQSIKRIKVEVNPDQSVTPRNKN